MSKTVKYFKYGIIGFLIGLAPSIMSMKDNMNLNKIFGWFYHAPFVVLWKITSCSGEGCTGYAFLSWTFWPILGFIIGIIVAKKRRKSLKHNLNDKF